MKHLSRALVVALAALAVAAGARAEPQANAASFYAAGDFLAAAESALDERSAQGFSLAARALMAQCLTGADRAETPALLTRAEAAAESALALDPDSVEARLQLALALGMRGRQAALGDAYRARYAPRGRRLIEEALALDPDNAFARALLGGWHLEVLRRGGRMGAMIYGARLSAGLAAFESARALAPDDPVIALHYAVALLELDAERFESRAGVLLDAAAAVAARDAFEAYAVGAAARLADTLANKGPAAAGRLAALL